MAAPRPDAEPEVRLHGLDALPERDFERANQHALARKDYATGRMVFPHRALFEH